MNPAYTFIAHKPASEDYCMGCHVASYSGDFQFWNHMEQESLIEKWASLLHANLNLDHNEEGYGFIILRDGIKLYDTINSDGFSWDGRDKFYLSDEYKSDPESFWGHDFDGQEIAAQQEMAQLLAKATAVAEKLQVVQKAKEKAAAEAKKAKEETDELERRKKQFEKLKQEFGGGL